MTSSEPAKEALTVATPPHVGLVNLGCTCYLSSLLQELFHISYFRRAVYMMTGGDEGEVASPIPSALQQLFYQMQKRKTAPTTLGLTEAFGWGEKELYVQQDIQELLTLLRDNLETRMKGSRSEGAINRLFEGKGVGIVATLDGTYTSKREESFYDVHLPVQGYGSLVDSLKSLTARDQLAGDNKYRVEEEGKPPEYKDAERWYEFIKFPPVLVFHLKRFEMDLTSPTLEMKKVHTYFEFPTVLDLRELEMQRSKEASDVDDPDSFTTSSQAIYDLHGVIVHRGTARSGHYYCYIRRFDGEWGEWMEFDDEMVRYVPESVAVGGNFGGQVRQVVNGYALPTTITHSAYVLSYIRRSDLTKVLCPTPTNIIPQTVKDHLQRIMEEDECRAQIEAELRTQAIIHVVTDAMIAASVRLNPFELVPREHEELAKYSFRLKFNKHDRFADVYNQLGSRLKLDPSQLRLWRWHTTTATYYFRPSDVLKTLDQLGPETIQQVLGAKYDVPTREKQLVATVYVEVPRTLFPPAITNVFPMDVKSIDVSSNHDGTSLHSLRDPNASHVFRDDDRRPTVLIRLAIPVEVTTVIVTAQQRQATDTHIVVELFADEDALDRREACGSGEYRARLGLDRGLFIPILITKGPDTPKATIVEISRRYATQPLYPLTFRAIHVNVAPEDIAHRQHQLIRDPMLPRISESSVLLMLKLFDPVVATMTFVGPLIVERMQLVGDWIPAIAEYLGIQRSDEVVSKLALFGELDSANGELNKNWLFSHHSLTSGSTIIVQLRESDIPPIYRFASVERYYQHHSDLVRVTVRQVSAPDVAIFTMGMPLLWPHEDVVECIAYRIGQPSGDYIRIYGPKDFATPTPRAEPIRSDGRTPCTLQHIIRIGNYYGKDIFYEVLTIPRKEAEAYVRIKAYTVEGSGPSTPPTVVTMVPGSTVDDTAKAIAAAAGVQAPTSGALLLISDSVIVQWYTLPCSDEFRPDTYGHWELRCLPPLPPNHAWVPCLHNDQTAGATLLNAFGSPLLLCLPLDALLTDALHAAQEVTGLADDALQRPPLVVTAYGHSVTVPSMQDTVTSVLLASTTPRIPALAINHSKPKERPGSKYVAASDTKLSLERRK